MAEDSGFNDIAPWSNEITPYDRGHFILYLRLHDATTSGAEFDEIMQVLFGIDADRETERARRVHDTHLARAEWMTEVGYRQLVHEDQNGVQRPPTPSVH